MVFLPDGTLGRMRRNGTLFTVFLVSILVGMGVARAEDKPVCSALLYEDAELLKALPDRLRPIVESARYRALITSRETAWAQYHSALDSALARPDRSFFASIGTMQVYFKFHRTKKGELQLWIDFLKRKDFPVGEGLENGQQFADFVMAQLGWIAKARATGKITNLSIIGKDLPNKRMIELLESLGFKSEFPATRCIVWGLAGGLAGYAGGYVYFAAADSSVENGSIEDEGRKYYRDVLGGSAVGAVPAVALACFRKTGRNYSIEFRPGELAPNPGQELPGEVPPIDLPPPGGEPIWPPKPMLRALPPARPGTN